jgi:hypothetical protein
MRRVDDQDPENVLQSFDAIFVRLISFKTLFGSLYTPPHFIIVASPGCEIGNLLPGLLDLPDRLLPVLLGPLPLVEACGARLLDRASERSITGPGLGGLSWDHRWMIFSVGYLLARCFLNCLAVLARGEVSKDAELLVLRHENAVLRRQVTRVRYQPAGRLWLAALSKLIPRRRWDEVFVVTPATLLTWHRRLVSRKWDYTSRRNPGRPPTAAAIQRLVIRIATDNPTYVEPRIMWSRAAESVTARPGVRQRFT